MTFSGFTYLNKHSFKDVGLTIAERSIGFPSKEKIKFKPPFSNHSIDFSEIYGSQVYTERELTYRFNIAGRRITDPERMYLVRTKLVNWLMDSNGQQKLYDDFYKNYYFLAEVESAPSIEENWDHGSVDVTFVAYPFMIDELSEGHGLWDDINFELDYFQDVEFTINGTRTIELMNVGTADVRPKITASSAMSIQQGNVVHKVNPGTSESYSFMLKSGPNTLAVSGSGTIRFDFHKELL